MSLRTHRVRSKQATPVRPVSSSEAYTDFYRALGDLREAFHRIGRFDDANAKLDELSKLLILKVLDARHPLADGTSRLSTAHLERVAEAHHGGSQRIAAALHTVFAEVVSRFPVEADSFGPARGLNIALDDDVFARALLPLLEALPSLDHPNQERWCFDGLNEAFGLFVQQSFRNRKEDAQYMTPPEVVSAMAEVAIEDALRDGTLAAQREFLIADPTCGVGSFLAAAFRTASRVATSAADRAARPVLFGQDKVERMVRLANANLQIVAQAPATVRLGNSILPPHALDDLAGRADLILTNPPFGAVFPLAEVLPHADPERFPVLSQMLREGTAPKTVSSEYLLLDRELTLLRPGGRMLIIVPDHVVSQGGFAERFRAGVARWARLVAVIDLPVDTFAQAGTRTRTSVVYLQRRVANESSQRDAPVFMATAEHPGFRVASRSGAPVKIATGANDFPAVVEAYRSFRIQRRRREGITSLSASPPVAAVPPQRLLNGRWTAGFYRPERLAALEEIQQLVASGYAAVPLPDAASIDPEDAVRVRAGGSSRCISVRHVGEDGLICLHAVAEYRPTTACLRCQPGDVLFSKINPRIMRVCVVPETEWQLACSAEFSILRCRSGELSPWTLFLLLRTPIVQSQIRALTSGTSSSHHRVKDRDLRAILLPVPQSGCEAADRWNQLARQCARAARQEYAAQMQLRACRHQSAQLTSPT